MRSLAGRVGTTRTSRPLRLIALPPLGNRAGNTAREFLANRAHVGFSQVWRDPPLALAWLSPSPRLESARAV